MTDVLTPDAKPEPPREFPIEVKVGKVRVTVTLLIARDASVAVKETKTEIEPPA